MYYQCENCCSMYNKESHIYYCNECGREICRDCSKKDINDNLICAECCDSSNDFSEDNNDSVDECKNINEEECLFYDE